MQTLSYGYKKPQNYDTGDIFFPAWELNAQLINDHNHDGVNSARPALTSQAILNANWTIAPVGAGIYMQTVTMPTGFLYDSSDFLFKLSTGELVYPSMERVAANQYRIYTNDNTLDYVAYYR